MEGESGDIRINLDIKITYNKPMMGRSPKHTGRCFQETLGQVLTRGIRNLSNFNFKKKKDFLFFRNNPTKSQLIL